MGGNAPCETHETCFLNISQNGLFRLFRLAVIVRNPRWAWDGGWISRVPAPGSYEKGVSNFACQVLGALHGAGRHFPVHENTWNTWIDDTFLRWNEVEMIMIFYIRTYTYIDIYIVWWPTLCIKIDCIYSICRVVLYFVYRGTGAIVGILRLNMKWHS